MIRSRYIGFFPSGSRCDSILPLLAASALCGPAVADDGMLGVLTPLEEVELEPRIEGQLVTVHVRIGDTVREGDVIAELEDESFQQALAQAEASLAAARAQLEAAQTQLKIAEEAVQRRRALMEQQAVSREALSESEQAVALALAELNEAEASVLQQTAIVEQYRSQLRHARIVAPFDSTIAERYANPGMTVAPGRPVARLISSEALRARFAAPVASGAELSIGRKLRIAVPAFGVDLDGTITQTGSEVDSASGMIICEAVVDLEEQWAGPPLSGQTVRVWLLSEAEM